MKRAHASLFFLASAAACGGKATQPAAPGAPAAGNRAPAAAGEPVFPEEPFRASQPPPTAPRDFNLPAMAHFQMGERDKIDVYLVERHDLPTISIDLNVNGGGMVEPAGKTGMAAVCMDMLAEGTRKLDKIAYNEALADLASSVSSYAGDDRQGVAMNTLTKSFDDTFALFIDTVTEPGMRQADLDRMIKRRLEALKQSRASAQSVSGRVSGAVIYGLTHPFGRVVTEKTLKAIRLSDCKRHHQRYIRPRGARLFIVGDTTEQQVRQSFAPLLVRWRGAPARVARPPDPRPPQGRIFFVNIPGAEQSSVSMFHAGPPRLAPDYFSTMLLAQVLGGGFASRINMNLREDKGYSYGAGGGFNYNRFFGRFGAGSSVRTDASYQSVHRAAQRGGRAQGREQAAHARRAGARQGGHHPRVAVALRHRRRGARPVPPAGLLRPAGRLLQHLCRPGPGGDGGAGPAGRGRAPRSGRRPLPGRRRRRRAADRAPRG